MNILLMHKCAWFPTIINDAISLNVFGNMCKTSYIVNGFDIVCQTVLCDGGFYSVLYSKVEDLTGLILHGYGSLNKINISS